MFDTYPIYSPYRTLQLLSPNQRGEDVFALQTALNECNFDCGVADGIFGVKTWDAVEEAQRKNNLVVDGKAGGKTQQTLAMLIAWAVGRELSVPVSGLKGQLEFESGYRLGNYSAQRPDKSYDAGVAQRNTNFTDPSRGFDTKDSILALCQVLRKHFLLFDGLKTRRRWELAQGAWNAPAFACYIAREEGADKVTTAMIARPTDVARVVFLNYIDNVTVYLTV